MISICIYVITNQSVWFRILHFALLEIITPTTVNTVVLWSFSLCSFYRWFIVIFCSQSVIHTKLYTPSHSCRLREHVSQLLLLLLLFLLLMLLLLYFL